METRRKESACAGRQIERAAGVLRSVPRAVYSPTSHTRRPLSWRTGSACCMFFFPLYFDLLAMGVVSARCLLTCTFFNLANFSVHVPRILYFYDAPFVDLRIKLLSVASGLCLSRFTVVPSRMPVRFLFSFVPRCDSSARAAYSCSGYAGASQTGCGDGVARAPSDAAAPLLFVVSLHCKQFFVCGTLKLPRCPHNSAFIHAVYVLVVWCPGGVCVQGNILMQL